MKKLVIPFNDIPQLSSKDKAYSTGNQNLKPFYKHGFEGTKSKLSFEYLNPKM